MEQSKVYFTTFKATEHENLLQKLHRLMKTAGFEQIDFTDKYAAIKIHFGEYGNLAFLRPNYAKVVADYVKELGGKKLAIVPILRAGLGMVDGMLAMIPSAKVGHIGLYRDPVTVKPVEYYCKLPEDCENRDVFVVDPMLATGGSSVAAIQMLKDKGVKNIKFMCIIAAPEGVKAMQEAHPDVDMFIGALDEKLNEHSYIVPGLGDAGDRIFGTK